eukprot:TRINITY_DN13923_c0_g1_i2.p1 TRINITY_DN13923_c0_g1~~TRINITY_DN13923_c0_g1_i2.p1  ORF type:complete len:383 (-),score=65.18 TRINITY_DN13923_c0_g1_i2:148-1296(-)
MGGHAPLLDGMMMLANGCAASIMAFSVSQMLYSRGDAMKVDDKRSHVQDPARVVSGASGTTGVATEAFRDSSRGNLAQEAWPSFRRRFFNALCMLWVGVCTIIVGRQFTLRIFSIDGMALESLRVFAYGWLTCVTTGLGAVPFMFVGPSAVGEQPLAVANAVAAGMMLAASGGMLVEAHEHCGFGNWQIVVGLLVGGLFIRISELLHGDEEEDEGVAALHDAILERKQWRKAMLIFTVMFCHSAAEGIAVGVAFSRQLRSQFGVYIALLLAVHNVPEGLAVALVLVPRGVSSGLTALIAMLTSVPQPLLALAAFLFVEVFQQLLPLGLAFAAGAMVYVCLHELLTESVEQLGMAKAGMASILSFVVMSMCIYGLQVMLITEM